MFSPLAGAKYPPFFKAPAHELKAKETNDNRKTKETKEEKEKENLVVNNICGKSNGIRW